MRLLLISAIACLSVFSYATPPSPNFLVIVVDDMGWSDAAPFGGEIHTPNITSLAKSGILMTDFYVAPTCSPTRSSLLTGVDHHSSGLATMDGLQAPNQESAENYQGQLSNKVVTVSEALHAEGYATLISGKWHLAKSPEQMPDKRGFEQAFILKEGGSSHFADQQGLHQDSQATYQENGQPTELPTDFYSSVGYTDKMIEYIQAAGDKPFFGYLAYTAPHDPLQVPDAWLNRYQGKYDVGPEVISQQRLQRQQQAGLIPDYIDQWQSPVFPKWLPNYKAPWQERSKEQKQQDARAMEIYASMIEIIDQQIGRLLSELEAQGKLVNTYILFFSDNGANAATPLMYPHTSREWFLTERDNSAKNAGKSGSHLHLGQEWAAASGTPWKLYKASVGEGGIRSPFIVTGPKIPKGKRIKALGHVMDITPTLYTLANVDIEENPLFDGKIRPQGKSLLEKWTSLSNDQERTLAFELFGNRAVRSGRWKAHNLKPPLGSGDWELYDIIQDPAETQNLSQQHPEIVNALIERYNQYATTNNIIPPNPQITPDIADLHVGECNWWCETKFQVVQQALKFML